MQKDEKRLPAVRKLRPKGLLMILLCGAVGILLLIVGSFGGGGGRNTEDEETEPYAENNAEALALYAEALEKKIAALCEGVSGISDVRVAVTLESGYEYVYAKDAEAENEGGTTVGYYRYVTIGSGSSEKVVYLSEKPPRIAGIGIVCRGGGSADARRELMELISAAFDVSFGDVYITEGR